MKTFLKKTFARLMKDEKGVTLVEYAIAPITIQSGDFLVGFSALNPVNAYPAVVDTTPPSRLSIELPSNRKSMSAARPMAAPRNIGCVAMMS